MSEKKKYYSPIDRGKTKIIRHHEKMDRDTYEYSKDKSSYQDMMTLDPEPNTSEIDEDTECA